MRTADDFNRYYSTPDPWRISSARYRDATLRRIVAPHVSEKSVLELGCGEGHLTGCIFNAARDVVGVDISDLAISRARELRLLNASFKACDFLDMSFEGYDVIAAIETLYYLSSAEQERFFAKVVAEHQGGLLIVSGPIIGQTTARRYFDHGGLLRIFERHGIVLTEYHSLNLRRRGAISTWLARAAERMPAKQRLLDLAPESIVYQRCYIGRVIANCTV